MTLGIDLSASKAKVARAVEHLDLLERKIPADLAETSLYAFRFGNVDEKTGWCDVSIVPNKSDMAIFGIVFGDVMHNLRCALDYVVTELVDTSAAVLTSKHQFPVYANRELYQKDVGTPYAARRQGPLRDVAVGLGLMEQLQPYHVTPDPREDMLWHVHRFSNADKHRVTPAILAIPFGQLNVRFNGTLAETKEIAEFPDWSPNKEYVMARLRFDPPVAERLRVESPIHIAIVFTTPSFKNEPTHSIPLGLIRKVCDHVGLIVELFESI